MIFIFEVCFYPPQTEKYPTDQKTNSNLVQLGESLSLYGYF